MKNIHILPTDNKPSRLYFNVNDKEFQICEIEKPSTILKPNRHIYITSNEEITVNDYITDGYLVWKWKDDSSLLGRKKVILTTDQDLIGVQAIDDEFLEWFVKNPSCEEVEVEGHIYKGQDETEYTIIIPKEESKPFKDMLPLTEVALAEFKKNPVPTKKETLEEVAENFWLNDDSMTDNDRISYVNGFVTCVKWQQERMYSEVNILINLLKQTTEYEVLQSFRDKVEQFKKRLKDDSKINI